MLLRRSSLGTCYATKQQQPLHCNCSKEWEGVHCEKRVDYCKNITCENNAVCRSLTGYYLCECLGDSFSGLHCEIISRRTAIYQAVSKSLGYIAILSLTVFVLFILIMDLLKYGFGIDPVREERELLEKEKQARKRRTPVIQRFVYVNRPPTLTTSNEQISAIQETSV